MAIKIGLRQVVVKRVGCFMLKVSFHKPFGPFLSDLLVKCTFWSNLITKSSKGCYLVVGQTSNTNDIEQYFMKWRDANMYCNGLWSGATLGILPNPFYNWFIASQIRKMVNQISTV